MCVASTDKIPLIFSLDKKKRVSIMSDNNSTTDNDNQPRGIEAVKNHMLENKIETALWISRVLSIVFAVGYILPIFG